MSIPHENRANVLTHEAHAIILDIEGTTTSIDFIRTELFGYAKRFLNSFVNSRWEEDEMKEIVQILVKEQEVLRDHEGFVSLPPVPLNESEDLEFKEKIIAHLTWQQLKEMKTIGLKRLQGYILEEAFTSKELMGDVYPDIPNILKYWKDLGKKIYIYSSGTIQIQKLLFATTDYGDLNEFIDGNFDSTIGSKDEAESYSKIVLEINENPENIVFCTDRPKEVTAAKLAGMKVIRVVRDFNNPYLEEEKEFIGSEDAVIAMFYCCKPKKS